MKTQYAQTLTPAEATANRLGWQLTWLPDQDADVSDLSEQQLRRLQLGQAHIGRAVLYDANHTILATSAGWYLGRHWERAATHRTVLAYLVRQAETALALQERAA